jgi:predicted nucleotidyltransferase
MNSFIQKMNNNNQKFKVDEKSLEIVKYLAKEPNKIVTTENIFEEMKKLGWKTNYPTVFRKVDSLINQNFILKEKYGVANRLQLNLNNDMTKLLLSLFEVNNRDLLLNKLRGSLRINVMKIIESLEINPIIKTIIIFGSYAKKKERLNSDLDLLIICENLSYKKYGKKNIRNEIIQILKTAELRTNIKFNPIIVNINEYCEMLKNNENNVGKESLLDHIILYGEYEYWRGISKCYQKKN